MYENSGKWYIEIWYRDISTISMFLPAIRYDTIFRYRIDISISSTCRYSAISDYLLLHSSVHDVNILRHVRKQMSRRTEYVYCSEACVVFTQLLHDNTVCATTLFIFVCMLSMFSQVENVMHANYETHLKNSRRGPPSSWASSPEKTMLTGRVQQNWLLFAAYIADFNTARRLTITVSGSPHTASVRGFKTLRSETWLLCLEQMNTNSISSPVHIQHYNTRSTENLPLSRVNTAGGARNVKFKASQLWNTVPEVLKSAPKISTFKKCLKHYLLSDSVLVWIHCILYIGITVVLCDFVLCDFALLPLFLCCFMFVVYLFFLYVCVCVCVRLCCFC